MPEPIPFEQDLLAANGISPEVSSNGEIKIKLREAIRAAFIANTSGGEFSEAFVTDFGVQTHLKNIESLIEQIQT
jgi:hypothetical protein